MKLKMMITAVVLTVTSQVFAANGNVAGGFTVHIGETKSVRIASGYVEQIQVQAMGEGSRDGMIEVWANGKPKGSLYVPGRDPNYIVTIRESISSLEFRSVSGGGVYVQNVFAIGRNSGSAERPSLGLNYNSESAKEIAQSTIETVNALKTQANLSQLELHIMPIRKSAARLYAVASANSQYSQAVRNSLLDLLAKIQSAEAYIDQNLETDSGFDSTTNLMTIKEQIKAMLR